MQTTSLYIEMIILGAEVATWILTIFSAIDDKVVLYLEKGFSYDALAAVVFLCLCYVLGILCDRFADWVFSGYEQRIKAIHLGECSDVITYQVWHEEGRDSYYEFVMSHKRIIRGTVLNALPIAVAFAVYAMLDGFSTALLAALLVSGVVVCVFCRKIYAHLLNGYYKNVKKYWDAQQKKSYAPDHQN
ncbi:MAG: hypothetical protein LBU77_04790 [Clostridiales bacterium]|jgi:hypothetical protein|nr:hypothetical protein [Clostridiales bacterium]